MNQAYIYDAIRTPRGRGTSKATGALAGLSPFELLDCLYKALEGRTGLDKHAVEDVILGCVTQAKEQAGNIAKSSLMYSGWPEKIPGMTVNRYCSSGLDAINLAALKINVGQASCVLAGGIEMMSRVPMMSDQAAIFSDPALAAKCRMLMMGSGADLVASLHDVSREQADEVAFNSHQKAAKARSNGWFKSVIPVLNQSTGQLVEHDECIRPQTTMQSLKELSPSFAKLGSLGVDALQLVENPNLTSVNHVHTPGNSPALADAAALVLVGDSSLQINGRRPRAKIVATASVCGDPLESISGCVIATEKLMTEQSLVSGDVDLFELHEAFAATIIKCREQLNIDDNKLNVNGGVIALGHPMGATGAIMAGTLIDELERRGLKRGIVAASGAAGTGTAMLLEIV
jgi:acetyl-CoA C-acetyltransferase